MPPHYQKGPGSHLILFVRYRIGIDPNVFSNQVIEVAQTGILQQILRHGTNGCLVLCDRTEKFFEFSRGATLYQEITLRIGTCPATVTYKITDQDRARGSMTLKGVTAFWVSGVSSSVSKITANLQNGLHQHFVFERPRDAPSYSVDANYALELEKNRLLKQQVEAIENITVTVDQSTPAPTLQTHCTTNRIGTTSYTNCY
jgi:hypothetical protein